jgi:hypothetical protein
MGVDTTTAEARAVTSRLVLIMRSVTAYDPKVTTQTAFAEAIKTNKIAISKWIGGEAQATVKDIVNVCKRFRANPIYIILGTGDMFLTQPKEMKNTSVEMTLAELNLRLSQLEIDHRKNLISPENGKKKR